MEKTVAEALLSLEDNLVNRALLLLTSIISPIGLVYLFFRNELGDLGTYGFIFLISGFSPFLIGICIRYHLRIANYTIKGSKTLELYINKLKESQNRYRELRTRILKIIEEYTYLIKNSPKSVSTEHFIQLKKSHEDIERNLEEISASNNRTIKSSEEMLGKLIAETTKEQNVYLIRILSDFIYYFLIVFFCLIFINSFFIKISFLQFFFSILVAFVLITSIKELILRLSVYWIYRDINKMFKECEESVKEIEKNVETSEKEIENFKNK